MERVRIFIEKLVEYLKKIKNLDCLKIFQNRDYFKIYKNRDVNEFFWLMCILGGILCSKKVCKKLKIFWVIYHISSASLVLGINIYGFVHINEKNLTTILLLFRPVFLLLSIFGAHVSSFLFYETIERYADDLDEYLNTSLQQEDDQHVDKTISQCLDMLVSLHLCFLFFLPGVCSFFPFVIGLEEHSKVVHFILIMVKFYAVLPSIVIPYSGLRMRAIFVKKLLSLAYELINQMKMFSNTTLQNLELTHQQEMTIEIDTSDPEERNYRLNLLTRRKNAIYENVGENIAYFSKQHHKWTKIQMHVKPFYEFICSITISCACLLEIVAGIDILQVMEGRSNLDIGVTAQLLLVLISTYVVNKYCDVVSVVDDVLQKLCNEVYSLPWYLLSIKNRKMIALLLMEYQYVPQFRIFGMYQFGAPLMPQMLYSVYSYISFFRVVMLKGSR